MGKWIGYHLTLGPGDRDPAAVAADLRLALPEAVEAAGLGEYTDREEVLDAGDPAVRHDGGVVHWSAGKSWSTPFGWWEGLVPALDVPAEWAVGLWQQEVEYYGGAALSS